MGSLRHVATGEVSTLLSHHTVGRDPSCTLQLDNESVSVHHAVLRWVSTGWEVRDLGSRNGTLVDRRPIARGGTVAIKRGSTITFGDGESFEMVSDSPPVASAHRDGGATIFGEPGSLFLPDAENVELIAFEDGPGVWFVETTDGDCRPLADQEQLEAGGHSWRIALPLIQAPTWSPESGKRSLDDVTLRFTVSLDEENVAIAVLDHGPSPGSNPSSTTTDLPERSHNYMLLTLARARLADRDDPELPEDEQGWVSAAELARGLRVSGPQLRLLIHRGRQQFRDAGFVDAIDIVERRPMSQQVRLGVGRVEIVR